MSRIYIGNVKGPQGNTGATGETGAPGAAATVDVGSVSTTAYGNPAQVINSGTPSAAVFDFVIPQGQPGEEVTDMSGLTLGTMTSQTAQYPTPQIGDNGATLWGKVVKYFSDLRTLIGTKLNTANIVNNKTTTEAGYALDGRQANPNISGTLAAQISSLNDSLVSTRSELHRLLGSYGFNSNKYLDIKTSNYNGFYFTMLIIVGTTVATIRVAGTDTPSVTAVCSAPIALLSATTITNGVRINYDASSVRGGIIIFAPYATLEALTIEETSKS